MPEFLNVAYRLERRVHLTAVRDADYVGSVDGLFDDLATIRGVTVMRPNRRGQIRRTHTAKRIGSGAPLRYILGQARHSEYA